MGDTGVYNYMSMIRDIEVIQTALAWSDLLSAPLDEGIEACRRLEDAMSSRQVEQQQAEAEAEQQAEAKRQVEIKNSDSVPYWTWIRIAEQWFAICRDRYVKSEDIPGEISIHRLDGTESQHKVRGHVLRGWNATLRVGPQIKDESIQIEWCGMSGCCCAMYRWLHLQVVHTPGMAYDRYIAYIDGHQYGPVYGTREKAKEALAACVAEIFRS